MELKQAADPANRRRTPHALWPSVAGLGIAAITLMLQRGVAVNHDVAWLAIAAQRLAQGGQYGSDIMEISPPVAIWVYAPVTALHAIGLAWPFATKLYLAGLFGAITSLCLSLIPYDLLEGGIGAAAISAALCVPVLSIADFGQKDEVALWLQTPLLCLLIRRAVEPRHVTSVSISISLLAGALAGLGGLIKPPLILALPILWTLWCVRRPPRRSIPELWCMFAIGGAGLIAMAVSSWWKLVQTYAPLYAAYDNPLDSHTTFLAVPAIAGVLLGILYWRADGAGRRAFPIVAGAAAGALISILWQHKFWKYHILPLRILVAWMALYACFTPARPILTQPWRRVAIACAILAVLLTQSPNFFAARKQFAEKSYTAPNPVWGDLYVLLNATRPGQSWVYLDTAVRGFPAALYVPPKWASQYPCLWPLPWIVAVERSHTASAADRQKAATLREAMFVDLNRNHPDLIAIWSAPVHQAIATPFDLLAYLETDPTFAARLARDYRKLPNVQPDLRVFARNP